MEPEPKRNAATRKQRGRRNEKHFSLCLLATHQNYFNEQTLPRKICSRRHAQTFLPCFFFHICIEIKKKEERNMASRDKVQSHFFANLFLASLN